MRSGLIYCAVAALCIGAAYAEPAPTGVIATSTLMLGSVSEISDDGLTLARAKISNPGEPQSGQPNVAITTVTTAEGYSGEANAEGASTATTYVDDGYGNDAESLGSVTVTSNAQVDDYGNEMAYSLLDAVTRTDQNGEGEADAGAAGYVRGTVNGGDTEGYSKLTAGIARSRPMFAEVGYRGPMPTVHSTTDMPGSYSTAYLNLHQSACADNHEEACTWP